MQPTSAKQFEKVENFGALPTQRVLSFKKPLWLGFILVALAGVSYAAQGILGKWAYAEGANVPTVLTIRYVVAGLAVALVVGGQKIFTPGKAETLKVPRRKLPGLLLLGTLWIPNSLLFFLALELIPASTAALLVFVFPALVVLWERLFFGVKLSRLKIAALVLAIIGCCLTVDPVAALSAPAAFSWLGVLLVLGSAFSNSWYSVLAAPIGRGLSGLTVSMYIIPVAAMLFGLYSLPTGSFLFGMSAGAWFYCGAIGVLTGFSIVAYLIGIKLIGASRAAITSSTEPASSIFMAALLLGEPLTFAKFSGGLMIISAILLLTRRKS